VNEPKGLAVEPLNQNAFAPFGKVLSLPLNPPTGGGKNYKYWSDLVELPGGNTSIGILQVDRNNEPIEMLEAHTEPEMLICGGKPVIIVVAGPGDMNDPHSLPKTEEAMAFLLQPGQGVRYVVGAWHSIPIPLEGNGMCIFIVNPVMKGHGNSDDHWAKFENGSTVIVKK
jgi:ureidoglycolate hydrolase